MNHKKSFLQSTVAQKYVLAATGLLLLGFLVTHLAANLLLLLPSGELFNQYAQKLADWGALLYVAEIGLFTLFIVHAVVAIQITLQNRKAKPITYSTQATKGGPSKVTWGSRNMIYTGMILLGFLVFHIWQLKLGPNVEEGYVAFQQGREIRDLYRLSHEVFSDARNVLIYCAVMVLLGFHLRHGFWSAFQSLGLSAPKLSQRLYGLALAVAILLALGFFMIPVLIYFQFVGVPL